MSGVYSCYLAKHGDEYLLWDTGHAMTMPNVSRVAALWHPGAYGDRRLRDLFLRKEVCQLARDGWAADWALLVTIFGWLLLIGGLVRMLFPIWLAGMAATFSPSTGLIVGEAVVFLVIGAFLLYKAYISS